MTNIPKISEQAVREAYKMVEMINEASLEDAEDINVLKEYLTIQKEKFTFRQPELSELVAQILTNHYTQADGVISSAQFALYVLVIINSFYIQKEIDDIRDLFNKQEKTDE